MLNILVDWPIIKIQIEFYDVIFWFQEVFSISNFVFCLKIYFWIISLVWKNFYLELYHMEPETLVHALKLWAIEISK